MAVSSLRESIAAYGSLGVIALGCGVVVLAMLGVFQITQDTPFELVGRVAMVAGAWAFFYVPFVLTRFYLDWADRVAPGLCNLCGAEKQLASQDSCNACEQGQQLASAKVEATRRTAAELNARRAEDERQAALKQLDGWKALSPYDFEKEVAGLLNRLGGKTEVTTASNDGGVDVILRFGKRKYAIQCKRYNQSQVGRPDCQNLLGVVVAGKFAGGIVITTGNPSAKAMSFCDANRIAIVDGNSLVLLATKGDRESLAELLRKCS